MATKRQRRKRRRRQSAAGAQPAQPSSVVADDHRPARAAKRPAGRDERPPAPWGDFPLTEIVVFAGMILLIAGFFVPPPRGFVLLAAGLVLASLGGLELAIREHFAGYRSHTLLLSGALAVPVFGALLLAAKLPAALSVAAGLVVLAGAAYLFASAFRRRSGGALYRLRGG